MVVNIKGETERKIFKGRSLKVYKHKKDKRKWIKNPPGTPTKSNEGLDWMKSLAYLGQ